MLGRICRIAFLPPARLSRPPVMEAVFVVLAAVDSREWLDITEGPFDPPVLEFSGHVIQAIDRPSGEKHGRCPCRASSRSCPPVEGIV